jgi:hypothetical protein
MLKPWWTGESFIIVNEPIPVFSTSACRPLLLWPTTYAEFPSLSMKAAHYKSVIQNLNELSFSTTLMRCWYAYDWDLKLLTHDGMFIIPVYALTNHFVQPYRLGFDLTNDLVGTPTSSTRPGLVSFKCHTIQPLLFTMYGPQTILQPRRSPPPRICYVSRSQTDQLHETDDFSCWRHQPSTRLRHCYTLLTFKRRSQRKCALCNNKPQTAIALHIHLKM